MKVIVMVIIRVKIVYINVLMRLVSRTLGHVKLDWLPPSKVDRVNENDKDNDDKNNNKSECGSDDKDDSNDNESNNESDNENWMYWCNSEASE